MGNLVTPRTQLASHPASNIRAELLKELSETEIERLEFRWKQALEGVHGEWPDPTASEDKRNEWLSRVTKVLYTFFLRSGIQQPDSRRDRIDDVRRVCVARQKYSLDDVLEYAKIELQLHKEGKSRTLKDVLENDMAVKQHPKAPKKAEPGAFANADIEAKANDAAEKALNHNREVQALRFAWIAIEDAKKYPKIDPGNLREKVRAKYECMNDDDLVDHKSYDRAVAEAAFASAIDEWQAQQKLAASVSPDEPKTDKIDDWFPRDKPVEEPKVEPEHWSKSDAKCGAFWAGVRGWMNKYEDMRTMEAQKRIDYTHTALGCDHLDQTPLSLDEAIAKVKAKIEDDHKTETDTPPSHDEPVALPVDPTPPVGVYSPDPKSTLRPVEAPPLNEGKSHHMEAPVIAYTTIIINDHRVNVTAREGATAEQVHDTVIALINGLRLIAADDTIKSYAAVVDSRDKAHTMKGNIKVVDAPHIPDAVATAPATSSNGHATDGGTVGCAMIKVGTSYTGGKPQLEFECDGMEHSLKYTRPIGDMVRLLSGIKRGDGKPFTAEDLNVGAKYGGMWRVIWKASPPNDEGKVYRNVESVQPA